jgi:penicillin G amidase
VSRLVKVLLGVGGTAIILLIALLLFLRHLVTKSFPQTEGTIDAPGLHAIVDVYRDEYGVPHIKASDEHDLMFATGYVQAQDRLWQMDLMRRAGEGRLSEVMGKETIDIDVLFRTIGLRIVADSIEQHLHPESMRVLQDYSDGVNAFLISHKGKFPVEFDMLNYDPEPWTVRHSIIISRLIAWELNLSWWTDLTYGEIANRVSPDKLRQILPVYPDSVPALVHAQKPGKNISDVREILNAGAQYRNLFGLGSLEAGSNAWVVDSSKSMSGKPLLANDPHLAMPAPSRWYELHLSGPGWNAAGFSLPGSPLIVIGHNDSLAWGFTNAMLDDADFFVETTDSLHPNHYIFRHTSLPIDAREEKIPIKNSDSLTITVRSTHHGPIVNDTRPFLHESTANISHQPVAMRWTGLDVSDELYGFYLMNRATSAGEFERGVREIAVPAQNIVYADAQGNIGYWLAGHVPLRGKQTALLPQEGSTGDADWKGFVPFEQLPRLWNPHDGVIASANQKMVDDSYPHYLSSLWEPPSRIERINELLRSSGKFTVEDFEQFQQDVVSHHAQEVTKYILRAFDTARAIGPDVRNALDYLRNWDFRFTKNDIAPSIFNTFFVRLVHNIFEDEMGPEVFHDFVFFGAIPYRVTSQLLASEHSDWFDNVATDSIETRDEIIRKSMGDAMAELTSVFGSEMKTWRWGELHTVTFNHPFGQRKPLDKIFNLGPFPLSGGGTTVLKSEYKFTAPFTVSVGPSMRFVIDLSDPHTAHTVITSGQSGQPMHRHYDDQTPLWLNGGYQSLSTDWTEIKRQTWEHLQLHPGNR